MSTDKKLLYIHVGYPKTGTTSLQHNLFEGHSGAVRLRRLSEDISTVNKSIIHSKEDDFANHLEDLRRTVAGAATKAKEARKALVWSHEPFTGIGEISNLQRTAKRINEIVRRSGMQSKVLVVIRRQPDIILSNFVFYYNKLIYQGVYRSIDEYVAQNISHCREDIFSTLFYSRLVNEYAKYFGKENIRVLMFEEMKYSCHSFTKKMSNFMGIDEAEAFEAICRGGEAKKSAQRGGKYVEPSRLYFIASQLKMNYLPEWFHFHQHKWGEWLIEKLQRFKWQSRDVSLGRESARKINDLYETTNRKLSEKYGVNVDKYGYIK